MKSQKEIFFSLLKLYRGHIKSVVLGAMLLLLSTIFTLLPPILIKEVVDRVAQMSSQMFFLVFVMIILATVVKGILYYAQRIVLEKTGQTIIHDLRTKTIRHINNLSFTYFDEQPVGEIISRVTSDTDLLANFFGFSIVNILNNILTIVGILVVLIIWQPSLSLAFIALIPFMIHAMVKYSLKVRPIMGQIRKEFGKMNASVVQTFSGIETIKLLGSEDFESKNFQKGTGNLLEKNINATKISSFWLPYVHFLTSLGTAFTLLWGGYLAINDIISPGMLIGFISFMGLLLRPIRQTGMLIGAAITAITAGGRVFEILSQNQEDLTGGIWVDNFRGNIELENVYFKYKNSDNYAIDDLSLTIPSGKSIALVGPSGAGKSTLINLIMGFYTPEKGTITIDGIDITELNLSKLREHTGYLSQEPFIFDGTILENITFGNVNASIEKVNEAIERAVLSDFIQSLPKGVNTQLGEKGVRLSGGQKQRLAIARVLITDPRILILDEPTSNLDKETEDELQESFNNVFKGRTVITIAHRLWTIENSDVIAFLAKGSVKAFGTHDYLYERLDMYQDFVKSQIFSMRGE